MKTSFYIKCLSVFVLLSALSSIASADNGKTKFEKLSLQQGVSHNLTYAMIQDKQGFMWFGTMFGLVKYDGDRYTVYRHNPDDSTSISFDDIISLFQDSKGNIWVGTWGGGLNRYNPAANNFTRFIHEAENKNEISDNIIWSICEDNDGDIWLGTETGGLDEFVPSEGKFIHHRHSGSVGGSLPSNNVQSVLLDHNNVLWVGTSKGLAEYLPKKNIFRTYVNMKNKNSISDNFITSLSEDSMGNLWIGTFKGLNKLDAGRKNFTAYMHSENTPGTISHDIVLSIRQDHKGYLWVGTLNGLNKFDPARKTFENFYHEQTDPYSLSSNSVRAIYEDKANVLWIAAYNGGINKFINYDKKFNSYQYNPFNKSSLRNNVVKAMTEDPQGYIYIGTYGSGVNVFSPKTKSFYPLSLKVNQTKPLLANFVNALALDKEGLLWIGTYSRLEAYNPMTGKINVMNLNPENKSGAELELPVTGINALFVDGNNKLWVGTNSKGLYTYDKRTKKFSRVSFDGADTSNQSLNYILTIYRGNDNFMWIGTYGGLVRLNPVDYSFKIYSHHLNDSKSLSNNYVFAIHEDGRGRMWIGTSNGLNLMDREKGVFTHYFSKDGLPNSTICGILEDDGGNLWISTNKGLSEFDPEKKKFRNFDISDGLQSNLFTPGSYFKDAGGKFYFGGNKGFNCFYPDSIKFNEYIPPVYITSLINTDRNGNLKLVTDPSGTLEYNYRQNMLNIEFAALDYSYPERNLYKYKLEGFDNNWKDAGTLNEAEYTNLDPGEYVFKVIGSNSDGVWNNTPAELRIVIQPPFWQTWWFRLLAAMAGILLIISVHRIRVKHKIRRLMEIEEIKKEQSESIRKKTAIDFHDELGHRLTRITLSAELLRRKLKDNPMGLMPILDNIVEDSHNLYDGTRDFIWSIDPQNDSLYALFIRLKDFGDELFRYTDIRFDIKGIAEEYQNIQVDMDWRRQVTLIFKEALNNALKHSGCSRVSLEVYIVDDIIRVILSDDGRGFEYKGNGLGGGLNNMKRRAAKINGQLRIHSSPGQGTAIELQGRIESTKETEPDYSTI